MERMDSELWPLPMAPRLEGDKWRKPKRVQGPSSAGAPDSSCADTGLPSPHLTRGTVGVHPMEATEGPVGPGVAVLSWVRRKGWW